MNIETYGVQYTASLGAVAVAAPPDTPLFQAAAMMLEMARAYADDGWVFFRQGDPVNAVASFTYGAGWRDAGIGLGYLRAGEGCGGIPAFDEGMPGPLRDHLKEKSERYGRMLRQAGQAVQPSADPESPLYTAGSAVMARASRHLDTGEKALDTGDMVNALASFSYGYGWIDAGVRGGVLAILHSRELFTV